MTVDNNLYRTGSKEIGLQFFKYCLRFFLFANTLLLIDVMLWIIFPFYRIKDPNNQKLQLKPEDFKKLR